MSGSRPALLCAVAAALALSGGCGKPEDARGYNANPQDSTAETTEVKTPAPAPPAFAAPLMGQSLHAVSKGAAICKGVLDVVTRRHTGPRPGSEIEGWAWDEHDARPLAHVLFVDGGGRIVGGATVGNSRTDVPAALPEVKTPNVGWKGVAYVIKGHVDAIGVTDNGATCTVGSTDFG